MIDSSFLPKGYRTDSKDGLYAEFYPDGSLKHLGVYRNGSYSGNWALFLEAGKEEGRAVYEKNERHAAEAYETYSNGKREMFHYSNDSDTAHPEEWAAWVRRWIGEIYRDAARKSENRPRNFWTRLSSWFK